MVWHFPIGNDTPPSLYKLELRLFCASDIAVRKSHRISSRCALEFPRQEGEWKSGELGPEISISPDGRVSGKGFCKNSDITVGSWANSKEMGTSVGSNWGPTKRELIDTEIPLAHPRTKHG